MSVDTFSACKKSPISLPEIASKTSVSSTLLSLARPFPPFTGIRPPSHARVDTSQRTISDAIDEGHIVRPSLLELMFGRWTPEMDKEVDVFLERVFDKRFAKWTLPSDRCLCLGDHEAIGRKPEHPTNLQDSKANSHPWKILLNIRGTNAPGSLPDF